MSNPFSSTGVLGKFWTEIKSLFVKEEEALLPEIIDITQAINNALHNQSVEDLTDAISPKLGGIPEDVLTVAQAIIPKVLATELGLQALQACSTPQATAAWIQSAISAFAGVSSNVTTTSKIWTTLAASLAVLFDQGKTTGRTWTWWINFSDQAYQKIQAALTAASAAVSASVPAAPVATTVAAS